MIYLVLPIVALLTATLSAIIGMGGGMLLLAAMFCFLSHSEAIPAHAAVQLISNSTRTLAFLRHVDWRTVGRFLLGVLPGSLIGVALLYWLREPGRAEPWLKLLVGTYILGSLLIPVKRVTAPGPAATRSGGEHHGLDAAPRLHAATWWDFPLLGVAAGTAAFTVGAVGPLIAPLFARRSFVKERLVATKALCQSFLHVAKLPAFLLLRSYENLEALGLVTLVMALLVIPGTLLGKRLLNRVSEEHFVPLYRLALLATAVKVLLADGIYPLLRGA